MKICAYCEKEGKLTNEHLWPVSLHRRMEQVRNSEGNNLYHSRLEKDIPSEPQIKDVCASCNNGVLSDLDNYMCQLFDKYFYHILHRAEKVLFEYDYDRLSCWLLKICYNSARMHNSDVLALKPLMPYVLG